MRALVLLTVALGLASYAHGSAVEPTVTSTGVLFNKFPCSQPDPLVPTVGWANIQVQPDDNLTAYCDKACGGYRLSTIFNPATDLTRPRKELCRFQYKNSKGNTTFIYGYFQAPTADALLPLSTCEAYSSVDKINVSATQLDGFQCGCCGTINLVGFPWETGCSAVTRWVPRDQQCPAGMTWQLPAGQEICRMQAANPRDAKIFGTIAPVGKTDRRRCYIVNNPRRPWERLCYRITPYLGPPRPDCENKNP